MTWPADATVPPLTTDHLLIKSSRRVNACFNALANLPWPSKFFPFTVSLYGSGRAGMRSSPGFYHFPDFSSLSIPLMVMAARIACRFATEKEETKQGVLAVSLRSLPPMSDECSKPPGSNMFVPYYLSPKLAWLNNNK